MSLAQLREWLRPNVSSGLPVYAQLIQQVKHGLETGALRPGEPLPGVRALAEELVISPNTVARAYRALEGERVIELRHGAGVLLPFTPAVARPSRARRDPELEAAREVQQRLLPQQCPPMAGLDCAGTCRPALSVGGDYYDFIRLSDTGLAIAVGDVCGKGIPAALLMATLRAYLHGQTLETVTDPAQVVRTLNRLLCDSCAANRYATFFYAQYDSSTRTLDYVNAGHNPPFVFRPRGDRREIIRLGCGGPVIGLLPDCAYAHERVTLERDDLLVAFTDGVSEAMNAAGEEWGEERLTETIGAHRSLSPRDLIHAIVREADEFAGGAAQHDDMTLVTIRVM